MIAEVGGLWAATWGDEEDEPDYISSAKILEFDSPRRMVLGDYAYKVKGGGLPFDADFVVEFDVTKTANGSELCVTQNGFPCIPEADAYYEGCRQGWADTFKGIRGFLESTDSAVQANQSLMDEGEPKDENKKPGADKSVVEGTKTASSATGLIAFVLSSTSLCILVLGFAFAATMFSEISIKSSESSAWGANDVHLEFFGAVLAAGAGVALLVFTSVLSFIPWLTSMIMALVVVVKRQVDTKWAYRALLLNALIFVLALGIVLLG